MPTLKCLGVALRKEADFTIARRFTRRRHALKLIGRHGFQRRAAQTLIRHAHKPLIAEPRLNRHATAIAVTHGVFPWPLIFQKTVDLEPIHNRLARVFARQTNKRFRIRGHILPTVAIGNRAVGTKHIDHRQIVAPTNIKIIRVMRGRDFQKSCGHLCLCVAGVAAHGKRHDNIVILDDWNFTSNNWQANFLAAQTGRARIFGIHGNRGVAKHGLGARGGHGDGA